MPRVISFLVLLTIILLLGAIFFRVMAQFIVPLFLAAVLLVVFQPLHAWVMGKLPGHPRICALCTTVLILLVVLLPLTWLGWNAYLEFHSLAASPGDDTVAAEPPVAPKSPAPKVTNSGDNQPAAAAPSNTTTVDTPDATNSGEADTTVVTSRVQRFAQAIRDGFKDITTFELPQDFFKKSVDWATGAATTLVISGVRSVVSVLVGLVIMVISLYYFLADGPAMIRTALDLSPLDSQYEQELLARFGQVSRAVVVATLLSAVVQGALAGIGYYWALPSGSPIFLLTAATMVTAMVPFFGAAAMWVPVCAWIYLRGPRVVDGVTETGDWITALILGIYSTCIVSGIDNVIKPFVLRGQSNLHPLLALLSILGGVQVLGPVGILVGPMLVSFLQALLEMLRKELDSFGPGEGNVVQVLAEDTAAAAGEIATAANAIAANTSPPTKTKPPARNHRKRKR